MEIDPIPVDIVPKQTGEGAEDPLKQLEDQGVQIDIKPDDHELKATIEASDGQTLLEYLDGNDEKLSMKITVLDGKTLVENVEGDTTKLKEAIKSFDGSKITVEIHGKKFFAEGGRATTASVFGERGPEWAIPEKHSDRTAQLLNAARAASGFTWSELLARFGGLNANPQNNQTTIVYSPTINANDTDGIERALADDKKRFERWFREQQMRDSAEVYA